MIIGIQGNQGDGKTALEAWLAAWYFKRHGAKIHANFWLDIPGLEPHYVTTLDDINKIYQGWAFFDEFYTWCDSRVSGFSDVNLAITTILSNGRKRGYNIVYESKRIHFDDRRIREQTDYVLEPHIYYNNNGSLELIEQNLLEPIDLTPYLNDLWVCVDKYKVYGNKLVLMSPDDDLTINGFRLIDVIYTYDTREEIKSLADSEKHAGIEKGIIIESRLIKAIKEFAPRQGILHNHNSLGWDVRTEDKAFDCVSVQVRNTSNRPYIDVRGKKIKELLLDAKKERRTPFWAYHWKGEWFCMPMTEEHATRSILNTRDAQPLKSVLV